MPTGAEADPLGGIVEIRPALEIASEALIGDLKAVTRSGWFAARPSGTEAVYKIYAESFRDEQHLQAILADARQIISDA